MYRLSCLLFSVSLCKGQQFAPPDPISYVAQHRVDERSIVVSWMKSGDPRSQAWSAYFISEDHLQYLTPELLKIVKALPANSTWRITERNDAHSLLLAVTDALIRSQTLVPATTVMKLYARVPDGAFILLARIPENRAALAEIFHREKDLTLWLAAANLLAQQPPRWFVTELLAGFHLRLAVTVADRRQATDSFGSGSGGGCGGSVYDGEWERAKSWPKIRVYGLVAEREAGLRPIAPGVHPVRYVSQTTTNYGVQSGSARIRCISPQQKNALLYGLLQQLAQQNDGAFALKQDVAASIDYTNDEEYTRTIRQILAAQLNSFQHICRDYVRLKLLPGEAVAALRLNVVLEITAKRNLNRGTLPALSNVAGLNLTIKNRP